MKNKITITATKNPENILGYSTREYSDPGSVPGWFLGNVLSLKETLKPDEKIVVKSGVLMVVKKNWWDRLRDRLKDRVREWIKR